MSIPALTTRLHWHISPRSTTSRYWRHRHLRQRCSRHCRIQHGLRTGTVGVRNVPVLRGSTRPSWAASFIPDAGCAQFHGTDGLGGFGPAVGSPAVACVSDSGETDIWKSDSAPYVSDSAESDIQSTTNTVYASDSGESDIPGTLSTTYVSDSGESDTRVRRG